MDELTKAVADWEQCKFVSVAECQMHGSALMQRLLRELERVEYTHASKDHKARCCATIRRIDYSAAGRYVEDPCKRAAQYGSRFCYSHRRLDF